MSEESDSGKIMPFRWDKRPSPKQIDQLVRFAGKLGLTPAFEVPPVLTEEEVLQEHLRKVFPPKTRQDYLGREHFWAIGDRSGFTRGKSSKLFTLLSFPAVKPRIPSGSGEVTDPRNLGLLVTSREEANMPPLPDELGRQKYRPSWRNGAMERHQATFGTELNGDTAVIQAEGVISLCKNPDLAGRLYGASRLIVSELQIFGNNLESLVDAQNS